MGDEPPGERVRVATDAGDVVLYRDDDGYRLYRHGAPHRMLPNQVPYIAHALALKQLGVQALLVTSSVGVMDADLPLFQPMVLGDLLFLDNRLPDGRACTLFQHHQVDQGHLVLEEGLFSPGLSEQLASFCETEGAVPTRDVLFAYVGGPRTKTRAENRLLRQLGAQVNSMSVGPEVVLAAEAEIPTAALCMGHKYSLGAQGPPVDQQTIADSLRSSRDAFARIVRRFLREAKPAPTGSYLYRFE